MQSLKSVISLLRPLSYFVVSVRHGSFSAAAKEMNLTPSVVSRTISELEDRLGLQLLHRSKTTLSLTNEGRAVFAAANGMLDQAARAETILEERKSLVQGPVRVTAPTVFALDWMPRFARELRRRHPNVDLYIEYDDAVRDGLDDSIDLAFRVQLKPPERYSFERLNTYEILMVAAPDLLPEGRAPEDPALLNDLPAIGRTRAQTDPLSRTFFHSETGAPLRYLGAPHLHVDNGAGLLMMTLAGLGTMITLEPFVRPHLQSGQLLRLLPAYDFGHAEFFVIWRSAKLSPTHKALIDIAKSIE